MKTLGFGYNGDEWLKKTTQSIEEVRTSK
jgi:hypothetical protein